MSRNVPAPHLNSGAVCASKCELTLSFEAAARHNNRDVVAALRFVHEHIVDFGGDPAAVRLKNCRTVRDDAVGHDLHLVVVVVVLVLHNR